MTDHSAQDLRTLILDAVERCHAGLVPSADKRGRTPERPYVPVIKDARDVPACQLRGGRDGREQILGVAFPERIVAIAYAQRVIDARKSEMAKRLSDPCCRAYREQWGLPRELPSGFVGIETAPWL